MPIKQAIARAPWPGVMVEPKICVKNLTKIHKSQSRASATAVSNVTLSIAEGEFICVLGPSGCGKSSLLLCLSGLETATAGEILIDGKPVQGPGPDRSIVFQEYALFPWRTVRGNIAYGPESAGLPKEKVREITSKFIRMVGLEGFEEHYPFQLSGGMKQRVAVARALAVDPEVLLMDEPFGALDAMTRTALQSETVKIWQATRKTIVFVTHSISEAILLADRVIVFAGRPGRVKADISIELPRPRDIKLKKFLDVQSRIEALVQEDPVPFQPTSDAGP
jgi:NitT/TauT family transport system ATP-binding protein